MSVADLLIGVLGTASGTVGAFSKRINLPYVGIIAWTIWSIALLFGALTSILHLIAISIDRFLATALPLQHRVHLTGRKVALLIAVCWTIPFIITSTFVIDRKARDLNHRKAFNHMFHCSTQFLAGCVILADGVFFACLLLLF